MRFPTKPPKVFFKFYSKLFNNAGSLHLVDLAGSKRFENSWRKRERNPIYPFFFISTWVNKAISEKAKPFFFRKSALTKLLNIFSGEIQSPNDNNITVSTVSSSFL